MMCVESATSISEVLILYERYYSFRRANFQIVSFIFSAALILIFAMDPTGKGEQDRGLVAHLSTCFRALDEMGVQFESAKRTSTFLSTLQREWHSRRRNAMSRGVKRKFDPGAHELRSAEPLVNQNQTIHESESGIWGVDSVNVPPYALDFMELDLCNILLSEGIPRSFI